MDKKKFITVLLVLVIVVSIITIVVNFSAGANSYKGNSNILITNPDDAEVSKVGLIVLPKEERSSS